MKQFRYLKLWCFIFVLFFIVPTSAAMGKSPGKGKPNIPDYFIEIDPAEEYPDFEYNDLTPACSNCPTCDSDKFTFFAKGGKENNLVVYFQGGGACWDSVSCLYAPTYNEQQGETEGSFEDTDGMGIFDTNNKANPFRKWNFVYIPYCTGDIHYGANDAVYPDIWDQIPGMDSWTIKHRGFVNFQVVLKWITDNFKKPKNIFVTGISAGSYGAYAGFPFIKEAFPKSRVSVLGDAGIGVSAITPEQYRNWNIQSPDWIPGLEDHTEFNMADRIKIYAEYYPKSKLAQCTNAWDETQTWFYNIQLTDENDSSYLNQPWRWEELPSDEIWYDWHDQMSEFVYDTAAASPNYRYYIAAGIDHTILMSPRVYTEKSAGTPFIKWLKDMVKKKLNTKHPDKGRGKKLNTKHPDKGQGKWKNLECEECTDPVD